MVTDTEYERASRDANRYLYLYQIFLNAKNTRDVWILDVPVEQWDEAIDKAMEC
jgi:hypothetical protein